MSVITRKKIILVNSLSPGDILLMSVALRSIHKAYPGQYETDVRSPCNEIFFNSPYITPLNPGDSAGERNVIEELKKDLDHPPIEFMGITYLIAHYPEIHRSGMTGLHFSDGHRMFMAKQLGIDIPRSGMKPDIFFSKTELASTNPLYKFTDFRGDYWVINAGIKKEDYTLKWYDHYQEVVDLLKDQIQFVQIGHTAHHHPALKGVIDMRGKTSLRQLFRVMNDAKGILTCVSMPMVAAAALDKPCVVVAGAREGVRWQLNPNHRYLYTNGTLPCAPYDGCWKSTLDQCVSKAANGQPKCMEMIRPQDIVRAIELYYEGGMITPEKEVIFDARKTFMSDLGRAAGKIANNAFQDGLNKVAVEEAQATVGNINQILKADYSLKPTIFIDSQQARRIYHSCIFNTLRILKKYNSNDQYYEAYKGHFEQQGNDFMDTYHLMWWIGSNYAPKRILEIGCRTGVSICQLLSSYFDHTVIQDIILCDNFSEIGNEQTVKDNLILLNIPVNKIQFMIGSSLDQLPVLISLKKKFDYILVDGCHDKDYARQDLDNACQLIDRNGFILFDDLTPEGCSLQDVWDDFKDRYKDQFEFMEDHHGKGCGVARKK